MINNLKSFMFDRAMDLSEEELNVILFDCGKQPTTDVGSVSNQGGKNDDVDCLADFLTAEASDETLDLNVDSDNRDTKGNELQIAGNDLLSEGVALMEGDVDDEGGDITPVPQGLVGDGRSDTEPTFFV